MAAPYDTAQAILNSARQRALDAQITPTDAPAGQVGGEVLSTAAPYSEFTRQTFNAGYRKMQEFLRQKKFSKLMRTTILSSAAVVATTDPAINCAITYDGYFDGDEIDDEGPTLPEDMISPIWLRERVHDDEEPQQFTNMEYVVNGITGTTKRNRNYNWAWDNEQIDLPGSTEIMDFELRYWQLLPDMVADSPEPDTPWYDQKVPIIRCMDALSYYVAAEACNARGDADGASLTAAAEAAATRLVEGDNENDRARMQWTVPDIPAQAGNTARDTVSTILNAVKVRLNIAAGKDVDVIQAAQVFTQQAFNNGFRRFQDCLADMGYTLLDDEIIIEGIPPTAATDPATQVYISWDGYYDGDTVDDAIVLPQRLIRPLKIWTRATGQNALFLDPPMEQILDGLPSIPLTSRLFNNCWEWRQDRIYMPGATQETDLRIRFAKYLDDFVQNSETGDPWYLSTVPVAKSLDPLSLFVCTEFAMARPDLGIDPVLMGQEAERAANRVYNRDVKAKQRVNVRRQSRSGRLEGMAGYGAYNWNGN